MRGLVPGFATDHRGGCNTDGGRCDHSAVANRLRGGLCVRRYGDELSIMTMRPYYMRVKTITGKMRVVLR